jgi:hypothetical protein
MQTTIEEIQKFLADLGDTPEAIAAKLEKEGYEGVTCDDTECVLANYLHDKFKKSFSVNETRIVSLKEPLEEIPFGSPVSEFIERFDNEEFPKLIADDPDDDDDSDLDDGGDCP